MKVTTFVEPSLVVIIIYNFYCHTLAQELWPRGHEICNFNIDPVDLKQKMLTHDDGRQPIEIGHLSYSGDQKKGFDR